MPQLDEARRAWIAILARGPLEMLDAAFRFVQVPRFEFLRRPETGLYMVRARAGGSGNRFNMGEVAVTRCVVRLEDGLNGVGYVLNRSHRHAELCALADAMLRSSVHRDAMRKIVIAPIQGYLEDQRARLAHKAQSTRVEFLTMVRKAGSGTDKARVSASGANGSAPLTEDLA
jgi:alpha-D-ribose 1-methylphosphonate 5-triphosphate synthase subunit PhnG